MNSKAYARLLWQIPVLILLASVLLPEITWYSSLFGAWPIWLLSMPVAAMVQHRLHRRKTMINAQAVKCSQVLVFNNKRVARGAAKQGFRQAA